MHRIQRDLVVLILISLAFPVHGNAQDAQEQKLTDAAIALDDFQADPAAAIPSQILQDAEGIVVLPNVIRAGFILGGHRGKGVALVRSETGEWSNPQFVTVTGGSVGAQIGGESIDIILVFGNRRSVRNIGTGKFTVGSNASATAGPVGDGTRGATDMTFTSEVYYYTRGRGLFAGATVEGAKLDVDETANLAFYPAESEAEPLADQSIATPAAARRFIMSLEQHEAFELPAGLTETAGTAPTQTTEEATIYPLGGSENQ